MYGDKQALHNRFRNQVTMRIDEKIFQSLCFDDNGILNVSVRILIALMIFKDTEGLSYFIISLAYEFGKTVDRQKGKLGLNGCLNLYGMANPIKLRGT